MAARKTTTSTEVKNRWNKENYSRIVLYLPKEDAARYAARCEADGKPMSDVPKAAIYDYLGGAHG